MRYVKIPPPGSFCIYESILEMVDKYSPAPQTGARARFVEVGCGGGDMSSVLLRRGHRGVGVDFSSAALAVASENLKAPISEGRYKLVSGDIMQGEGFQEHRKSFGIAMSMMVMEHVEDDKQFLKNLTELVAPKGLVMVAVPGRMDRWGIEDETVGHLRRYENHELRKALVDAGLEDVRVWSIGVPLSNLLFKTSEFFIKRSGEVKKVNTSMQDQTKLSGIREIPFKTVFPVWCRLILNRITLYPLFVLQRCFYGTNLGLTMLAAGRVKA